MAPNSLNSQRRRTNGAEPTCQQQQVLVCLYLFVAVSYGKHVVMKGTHCVIFDRDVQCLLNLFDLNI